MNIYAITAFVVVLAVFLSVFKQIKQDFALAAATVICIVLVALSLTAVFPLVDYISSLTVINEYGEYFSIIMKSVGTAIICTTASEICKDSGEGALSFGIETFCKCEIVAMSLPMIKSILELAEEVMN